MRQDVAKRLSALGFKAISDFNAVDEGGGNVRVDWISLQPMPSEAEIDAVDMSTAAVTARALIADRDAAVIEVDRRIQKAFMLTVLDEINLIRGLLVPALGARTAVQLRNAIIGKINSGAAD